MDNKEFWLVVSTLDIEPSTYNQIIDPLNMVPFSEPLLILATDEREAISKFVESDLFNQYCDKHHSSSVFIYYKGEHELAYHKAYDIPDND